MVKEIPRVLAIYDIDLPVKDCRNAIAFHFRKNGDIKDQRVIDLLLAKGYMELEETLLQWKQGCHVVPIFQPPELIAKKQVEIKGADRRFIGEPYKFQ